MYTAYIETQVYFDVLFDDSKAMKESYEKLKKILNDGQYLADILSRQYNFDYSNCEIDFYIDDEFDDIYEKPSVSIKTCITKKIVGSDEFEYNLEDIVLNTMADLKIKKNIDDILPNDCYANINSFDTDVYYV